MSSIIVTHPGPPGELASPDYTATAGGQPMFCYSSYRFNPMNPERIINGKGMKDRQVSRITFASFDFAGEAEIIITVSRSFETVTIRPLATDITTQIDGNVIRFTVREPGTYIVEPFGTECPIHIFANPLETEVPDPHDSSVYYFAAGIHYIDPLELPSDATVYIAGGAIVYANIRHDHLSEWDDMVFQQATIHANGRKRIKICGRGILCGRDSLEKGRRHKLIELRQCEGIEVEGVILRESSGWSFAVYDCEHVRVNNVKVMGHYINNDGIDICSSRHVRVENSFCHNADDSFLIKAHDAPVYDVTFDHCVAWNDVATSFGLVCETGHPVSDVTFSNCTVVHSTLGCWIPEAGGVLAIWNDYGGDVSHIRFRNMIIEDACADKPLIKLNISNVFGMNAAQTGSISNITFNQIKALQTADDRIVLSSPFTEGAVSDIVLDQISINGSVVEYAEDSRVVNEGATLLHFGTEEDIPE